MLGKSLPVYYQADKIEDAITTWGYVIQQGDADITAFSNLGVLLLNEAYGGEAVESISLIG